MVNLVTGYREANARQTKSSTIHAHQCPPRAIYRIRHRRCAISDLPSCLLTRSAIKPPIHPVLPPKIRTFVMGVGSVEEDMVEHVVEEKWRWQRAKSRRLLDDDLARHLFSPTLMWQNRMFVKKKRKVVKKKTWRKPASSGPSMWDIIACHTCRRRHARL